MKMIIAGCGRVGAGLAKTLSERGHAITVIDSNPAAFERLGSQFGGQTVEGICFDRDVLAQAGVERADGLAAVTSSDETNVVTAQVARQVFHVPKVVARLYDPQQADIYHRLGVQTIAPNVWGISRIADLLTHMRVAPVFNLGSGQVEVVEFDLPPLLAQRRVRDVAVPGEISVVAVVRKGAAFLPDSDTVFEAGDHLLLAVTSEAVERLNAWLN